MTALEPFGAGKLYSQQEHLESFTENYKYPQINLDNIIMAWQSSLLD